MKGAAQNGTLSFPASAFSQQFFLEMFLRKENSEI